MAKKAYLTPDAVGVFALKSTYDPALVALIKSMPTDQRAWHPQRKVWLIDWSRHAYLLSVLQHLHYDVIDEVKAELTSSVQQTPPGIWMLAGNPDAGRMQAQCPVCWNRERLAYYDAYADPSGATRLQFYSDACEHMWELCLQTAFGRLMTWTEIIEKPTQAEDAALNGSAPLPDMLQARQRRVQTFDFESWIEQAMDDEETASD